MNAHPVPLDSVLQAVVKGNTGFALNLYAHLRANPGNLIFSPYSISTALAMTCAGARNETETQVLGTLNFPGEQAELHGAFAALREMMEEIRSRGAVSLSVANRLWPHRDYAFLQPFLDICKQQYGATFIPVDYGEPEAARQTINNWVADATEEKIRDLIPADFLDVLTRLVLVNAIYFKGNWASQFDNMQTESASFWTTLDTSVDTPMMRQTAGFLYAETESLQIVEMPFEGDDLTLAVLLPKELNGLAAIEESLSIANLHSWLEHLYPCEVDLFLPRFRVNSNFRLDAALRALGSIDAFDEVKADFSGMDGRRRWLYIAAVLHQAYLEVNEEGAEAAAATAVVMKMRSLPSPPPIVRVDHPFLFLLREKQTGTILFLGRVIDPTDHPA